MMSDQAHSGTPGPVPADRPLVGARSGPTALRIALGAHLRRLREASHITPAEAGEAIRATHSKISRLERGRSGAKQRDVADLLSLYGVTDEAEREEMLALARQASTPGWWQQYHDILPRWFELYVGLEKAASIIRTYEVQFVHGLLQTEDYARAVILIAMGQIPDSDDPPAIIKRLLAALPSGSYLAISDGVNTSETLNEASRQLNENSHNAYHLRSPEQVVGFFDGLELVEPGVVTLTRWRPEATPFPEPDEVPGMCGIGRKP